MFEESIVVLRADDVENAGLLAREVGLKQKLSYENRYGETVTWSLVDVVEIQEISDEELEHGTEIFSRHFTRKKGDTRPFEY